MQKFQAIGNLGRDPETRYSQSGAAITNFSIAVTEKWFDKNTNQKQERTEWINCVSFGKQAETLGKYLAKGSKIYIEGKLETSKYEKEGQTRYSTKVKIREFEFLSQKQEAQGTNDPPPAWEGSAPDDEDIPF